MAGSSMRSLWTRPLDIETSGAMRPSGRRTDLAAFLVSSFALALISALMCAEGDHLRASVLATSLSAETVDTVAAHAVAAPAVIAVGMFLLGLLRLAAGRRAWSCPGVGVLLMLVNYLVCGTILAF